MARNDELSGFVLLEKFYSYKPAVVQLEKIVIRPESEDPDDRPIRPQTGLVSRSHRQHNNKITRPECQFGCKIFVQKSWWSMEPGG